MSRPTRPPGPPYPEEPYRRADGAGPIPTSLPRTSSTDDRRPPPPPTAQPRFTPRPGPQPRRTRDHSRRSPPSGRRSPTGPAPPPPHRRTAAAASPTPQPAGGAPTARRSRQAPSPDAAGPADIHPRTPGGGRHGGRPRPSFTPREGYTPPDDRRRDDRPAADRVLLARARRVPAGAGPGGVRLRAARCPAFHPGRPPGAAGRGQPHQDPRASGRRGAGNRAAAEADNTSPNLARSSRAMALGTIASRGTGFLRTFVLLYVLGAAGSRARTTTPTRCRTPCTTSCSAVSSPR